MDSSPPNILFSSTRQWNPGDEAILTGIRNILDTIVPSYNSILFNRNPGVCAASPDLEMFRKVKLPSYYLDDGILQWLEANLKIDFFDNSVGPEMDCEYADWAIFAGSPEWCNRRNYNFYRHILERNIPVMILGVGSGPFPYDDRFMEVIRKAKIITVRDERTYQEMKSKNLSAHYISCPAILSVELGAEKQVHEVKRIGLIYQGNEAETAVHSGCSLKAYEFQLFYYRKLIQSFGDTYDFELIVHCAAEIPLARRDFPHLSLNYSYDSKDYLNLYRRFDLVVGPRVHGVGMAASAGVPGIVLSHSGRSLTCKGFLADFLSIERHDYAEIIKDFERSIDNASLRSTELGQHKVKVMNSYRALMQDAWKDNVVNYEGVHLDGSSEIIGRANVRQAHNDQAEPIKKQVDVQDLLENVALLLEYSVKNKTSFEQSRIMKVMRSYYALYAHPVWGPILRKIRGLFGA